MGETPTFAFISIMTIKEILHPIKVKDFENDYFSKKALYINGSEEKYKNLFDWSDINKLLESTFLPDDDILIVNNGKFIKYDSIPTIIEEANNGATMVINKLHQKNKKIGLLTERIGSYFKEPVQVNLYLGQPDINGFNLHYDTHDVFIFQLFGKKKWEIYEANLEAPVFNMKKHSKDKPDYEPYISKTLENGDFLYVPRGHWHCPIAIEETSLHLTIGIKSRTGLDFLQWLKDELCEDLLWRKELTFNRKEGMNKIIRDLKEKIDNKLFVKDYFDYCDNNLWSHNDLEFPHTLKHYSKNQNLIVFLRPSLPIRLESNEKVLTIYYKQRKIKLSSKVKELVVYLSSSKELNLEKVDNSFGLTKNQIVHVCNTLINQGVLSLK